MSKILHRVSDKKSEICGMGDVKEQVLVMGASTADWRYSNMATRMLKDYGHGVTCFGKSKGLCAGEPILNEFPSTGKFQTVTLYLNPGHQEEFYEKIIALKPQRVIFNPGTENSEFQQMLETAGIEAEEACTLVLLRTGQY